MVVDIGSALFNTMVPYALSTGGGGLAGYACGFFLKKLFKIILFALGGIATLLGYLAYEGYISANFPKMQTDTLSVLSSASQTLGNVLAQISGQFGSGTTGYVGVGVLGFVGGLSAGLVRG